MWPCENGRFVSIRVQIAAAINGADHAESRRDINLRVHGGRATM